MDISFQEVQLSSLTPPQLKMLHDQLDQEIEVLTSSMQSLKGAQNQFNESKQSLKTICPKNVGKDILVPLTGSLYVPGQLADADSVLVDIGTGYYAEKTLTDADEFFKRKIDYLKQQMDKLQPAVQQKFQSRQVVYEMLQAKVMAHAKQQSKK
ncbi:unnamed protein product [Clavelina lepadiformis]|uniref:Prefoldin subunit 5 n=1 Tax=Clavelina lepadiformis TaxID=159417 RepID=A0ABP0FPV2_CLALP